MRRNLYKITHNQNLHVGVNKINFSHRRHDTVSRRQSLHGFTLIELLVVIAVIAALLSVLVPSLAKAKQQCREVVCRSNIRQLALANLGYVMENNSEYVLAAPDIFSGSNLKRWHGIRDNLDEMFDATRSPLASYLADGRVKQCPQKVHFRNGDPWDWDFEQGCGGYGYNMTYIGSRVWADYTSDNCARPTRQPEVRSPASTLMFADAAMTKLDGDQPYYLEYSFAEPYYFVVGGQPKPSWGQPSPSIHFRHDERANIAWCDGHVGTEQIAEENSINIYGVCSFDMQIGWFEPLDNSRFDLK
ncbi:MAG: prepilin-type N-terminal cleavage/methylation domain-containing protein [Phycisphaerae bacterium]|nr:prepilin-type N-terminal cleavage/methylation domain-containing protein [Phycisphaerae bacterium]